MLQEDGKKIQINNFQGIDIVGNLIEATSLSVNRKFYGNLHNDGHVFISMIHDPDFKFNEIGAVMVDTATAMRDPVFYRWHQFIDDLCLQHKRQLPPYTEEELRYDGMVIDLVELYSKETGKKTTELKTFWQKTDANLENGLDFHAPGPVYARFTHLNYELFSYKYDEFEANRAKGTSFIITFLM